MGSIKFKRGKVDIIREWFRRNAKIIRMYYIVNLSNFKISCTLINLLAPLN